MKWEGHRQSEHVEDRRGGEGPAARPRVGGRGIGIGTLVVALLAGWLFGVNPLTVLGLLGGGGAPVPELSQAPAQRPPAHDRLAAFVSTVLADTEDVWQAVFKASGQSYRAAPLVLFEDATPTACGTGESAMGPFYCPGDGKVYIDLRFFRELQARLGAPGDFAQAYVVAHEVGHHIQNLMGITAQVERQRGRLSPVKANELSVSVELQAGALRAPAARAPRRRRPAGSAGGRAAALAALPELPAVGHRR
jgi:predicted metalloprotease